MPQVTVSYLGMIQRVAGTRREQVELDDSPTLRHLLERLAERHGPDFRERVLEGNDLGAMLTILVDGVNCHTLGGLSAPLGAAREVEVVLFGPPLAGG
jgi:molybdopterin converting factor small subunit